MLKIERYNYGSSGEPAASFATDAEIAIADQLRHQLEQRYLAPSAPSSSSRSVGAKVTDSIHREPCGAGANELPET